MARKPNYRFERQERDRKKAAKKEAKAQAKADKAGKTRLEPDGSPAPEAADRD